MFFLRSLDTYRRLLALGIFDFFGGIVHEDVKRNRRSAVQNQTRRARAGATCILAPLSLGVRSNTRSLKSLGEKSLLPELEMRTAPSSLQEILYDGLSLAEEIDSGPHPCP